MGNYSFKICVVGAEVNNIEQRQLLGGIISEARESNTGIIVLSNLYNRLENDKAGCADNRIYELVSFINADAFILLSESFVDHEARMIVHDLLKKRNDVPVIAVGAELPEFEPDIFPSINTDDEKDIEFITDLLIEENGFTDISLLTGPLSLEPSEKRVRGYRCSLEKHGIDFDASKVYEGDFWYYSGERLAERYISGEIPYPQALVCANDYMAFGVLDGFAAAGVNITEKMALTGYEYSPERCIHTPLLTAFRRNRNELGKMAVRKLLCGLRGRKEEKFTPPHCTMISGNSCPCTVPSEDILVDELAFMRTTNQHAGWNLKSDMESRLTECRNYDEFISAMGEELFIVRNAKDIVLCLSENWFTEGEEPGDTLVCRNTNKYALRDEIVLNIRELDRLTDHFPDMAVFYFDPVFFKDRLMGYSVVMYDYPETYDDTYRHWLKSVSNALEFLRLKTDINYLMQCSTLSASYDGVTGLFNEEGMRSAFRLMQNSGNMGAVTAIGFSFHFSKDAFTSETASKEMVSSLVHAAKTVRHFCGSNGIAGRISENELLLVYTESELKPEIIAGAVYSEMIFSGKIKVAHTPVLFRYHNSFSGNDISFERIKTDVEEYFRAQSEKYEENRNSTYFRELELIRRELTEKPLSRYSLDEISSSLDLNPNYFNRVYSKFYGISFHQDQIAARSCYAGHLLVNTEMSVAEVAEKCEYSDSKYFIRQFTAYSGLSPKQYRTAVRKYFE